MNKYVIVLASVLALMGMMSPVMADSKKPCAQAHSNCGNGGNGGVGGQGGNGGAGGTATSKLFNYSPSTAIAGAAAGVVNDNTNKQGQGQGQIGINKNVNDVSNVNKNRNVNDNVNRQGQGQGQGQGQQQGNVGINSQGQSNSATGSGNTTIIDQSGSNNVDTSDTYEKYTPNAYAPPVNATVTCLVPITGAFGIPGFTAGLGSGVIDVKCEEREAIRLGLESDNRDTNNLANQVLRNQLFQIQKDQAKRADKEEEKSASGNAFKWSDGS